MRPQPGDYGCVSMPFVEKRIFGRVVPFPNLYGLLIQLGTWSRYSHSFIYVGEGAIIESQANGADISPLIKYDSDKVVWSKDKMTLLQRRAVVNHARSLLGTPYGFLDIVYLGLAILGLRLPFILRRVERQDRLICSQLVAVCGVAAGQYDWLCKKSHPCLVTPADLARRIG